MLICFSLLDLFQFFSSDYITLMRTLIIRNHLFQIAIEITVHFYWTNVSRHVYPIFIMFVILQNWRSRRNSSLRIMKQIAAHFQLVLYFQMHICSVNNSMRFVSVIILHNASFTERRITQKVPKWFLKSSRGDGGNGNRCVCWGSYCSTYFTNWKSY